MASSSKTKTDAPPFMSSSGSLIDSPENSLPGPSTEPQPLSPIEAAAEAARVDAMAIPEDPAVTATARVMADAAIEAAIQPTDAEGAPLSIQNITVSNGTIFANQPRAASEITTERNSTHGDYDEMSAATMDFMRVAEASKNWAGLPDGVKVMFFNFAQKQARILTGNPLEPDHYDDLGGYAYLAGKEVRKLKA